MLTIKYDSEIRIGEETLETVYDLLDISSDRRFLFREGETFHFTDQSFDRIYSYTNLDSGFGAFKGKIIGDKVYILRKHLYRREMKFEIHTSSEGVHEFMIPTNLAENLD